MSARFPAMCVLACFACHAAELSLQDCRALAQRVYLKLTRVVNGSGVPPRLRLQTESEFQALPGFLRDTNRVAFLDVSGGPPVRREIVIDERTVRLCAGMQTRAEDCVAFFLGHELAHWASAHDWKGHFARKMGIAQQDVKESESRDRESQADDLGMLYGALAGYDSLGISAQALADVYAAYAIPAALPGYMKLTERQAISRKSAAFLSKMLPLFDAATLMLAIGRYKESAVCYDAILESFPSREIFNNAGLARAFAAISAGGNRQEFDLPWMLDAETRLPAAPGSRGAAEADEHAALLNEARRNFEEALRRDPDYKPAHANLGLVLHLQNADSDEVALHLKKAGVALASANPQRSGQTRSAPTIARSQLFWQGKRPRESSPATRPADMQLGEGWKLLFASADAVRWFRLSVPGQQELAAVTILHPAPDLLGSMGSPEREFSGMSGRVLLFERLGAMVLAGADGNVQRCTVYEEF